MTSSNKIYIYLSAVIFHKYQFSFDGISQSRAIVTKVSENAYASKLDFNRIHYVKSMHMAINKLLLIIKILPLCEFGRASESMVKMLGCSFDGVMM